MADLAWYAVRTNIRCEDRARMGLEASPGLTAYLPLERCWRGRGPRRLEALRPLLSRHLFVGFAEDENYFETIRTTDGVEAILSAGGRGCPPQRVPYRALAIIQTVEGELADKFENAVKAARRRATMRDDTDEFIERLKAASPDERAVMVVEMLGRGTKARVPLATLQSLVY